jgi:hypothetical protein
MDLRTLTFGQSVAGLLVDGIEATPYTGATLKMEELRGVVVEIPYIDHGDTDQFKHVNEWFETRTPPRNLLLETPEGSIGLYGIRWLGHSSKPGVSLGKLAPSETLLGPCEASLERPLMLDEVRSRIDGLQEWTGLKSVGYVPETDEQGLSQAVTVNVRAVKGEAWTQGEAAMQFESEWRTSRPDETDDGGLNINDGAVLVTRFPNPRPFSEHLAEQRKIVSLLTLLSGQPIHFRHHRVSAESIIERALSGHVLSHPKIQLVSEQTVRDYRQPVPSRGDLQVFLAEFEQIGIDGITRWASRYEQWKRFVLPAVGVLGRKGLFLEDVIVSLSTSVEAAGQIIGKRNGEEVTYHRGRTTTATYVFRCLDVLEIKWGGIAPSTNALARAIANTYNDIKHFDRGELPRADVLHVVGVILRYIARLLALHIVDDSGNLLEGFRKDRALWRVQQVYETYQISFNERGETIRDEHA